MTGLPKLSTVIVADRLFDGHTLHRPDRPVAVYVREGGICAVGDAELLRTEYPEAQLDPYDDATISPGFIDSHVHLTMPGDGTSHEPAALRSPEDRFRTAAVNLSSHLRAGVTTVRDLGSRRDFLAWRPADEALVPRMLRYGPPLTSVEGHMRHFGGAVSSEDEARRFVYENASTGADGLKIAASGGGSRGTRPHEATLSAEIVAAAVAAARELGLRTTVHAMALESVESAILAGTDGIEHVAFLAPNGDSEFTEGLTARARDAGIAFGSTLGVNHRFLELSNARDTDPQEYAEQVERTAYYLDNARALRNLGVDLALGSDAGWKYTPFGGYFTEIDLFSRAGYAPSDILRTITSGNARHIGMSHLLGEVREGMAADLTVLTGDPSTDIDALRRVQAVYRDGRRVLGTPSLARPRLSEEDAGALC